MFDQERVAMMPVAVSQAKMNTYVQKKVLDLYESICAKIVHSQYRIEELHYSSNQLDELLKTVMNG